MDEVTFASVQSVRDPAPPDGKKTKESAQLSSHDAGSEACKDPLSASPPQLRTLPYWHCRTSALRTARQAPPRLSSAGGILAPATNWLDINRRVPVSRNPRQAAAADLVVVEIEMRYRLI